MRSGTIVSTMLAVAITVTGFALATGAIRPAAVSTTLIRRAWFLADLARLDALLTRVAARVSAPDDASWSTGAGFASVGSVDGILENELRIRWSESGVSVRVDGSEQRLDRLRVESIERAINPVPLLHLTVLDPYRDDDERWHLIAPFGERRVP